MEDEMGIVVESGCGWGGEELLAVNLNGGLGP